MLHPGAPMPHFIATDHLGNVVNTQLLTGKKNIVLFFYPKNFTPGCTKEACQFRDQFAEFANAATEVIGISSDTVESHRRFANQFQLPYSLISDTDRRLQKLFGVEKKWFLFPGRVTFVVNKQGVVIHVIDFMVNIEAHVRQALENL